ncbi:MAG: hypothetical protein K6G08_04360 [Prevotella sp.]|nr:hypothetical protein [Prevotella sp.]
MNHEIDAQQNAGDYSAEDEGKYVFMDVQADENGIIEVDLTKFDKADLNCICLPWDNANKGTVWYILLTEKDAKTIYLKPAIWDVTDATERYAVYMFNNNELNAWADFTAVEGAEGTFTATVPARYTGIVLGRMNGATTENNWDNVWNQTVDIKPVNDKALYTITGWGEGDGAKSTYEETVYGSGQPEPIVINSMAIVGDFTGGWPVQKQGSEEFDWSVAKQMTKSTENADVWTLTIENFEAEAKKYEYKAAANDSWEGYKLPAEGNADFVFGTDMYPAGKYNLTFTVNTKENTLTLGVEKVIEPFVAPFADGNYYIMNATEGLFIPQSGDILQADGYPFLFKFDNKEGSYSIIGNEFFAWDGKKWFAEGEGGFYKFYYIDKDNVKRYAVISSRNGMAVDVEENTTQENSIWMPLTQSSVEDQFMSYNVAGTEDLCGVAWDITKNKMARNTETDLFEWKAENITVTNEIKPEFKVVATLEDKGSVWYPEGGENSNWVITLGALGADAANPAEEGIYTITISFNAASKEIKVAGEKTGDYVPPVKPTDIAIAPAEGDIAAALKAAEEGVEKVGNITINLTKGVVYTISEPIVAPASITINGNDAFLDAANLTGNGVVTMADVTEPTEWTVANVRIAGLSIKGLKKPLFYSTCKNYIANMFEVDWVTAEIAADVTVFDFTKGSVAENFIVTNSTFYAPTATTKSFYSSQSGQKLTEWNGDAMQTFKFAGNTMYNLAPTKNFFTHRQANQKWMTYGVEGNIFVNCGKSGQVIKGMNGGQGGANPVWIIEGNAFNFDGADTSASEETGDANEPVKASVAGVVTFTDADAGNFNGEFQLAEGATAPEALGAPAWKITFKEYVAPIVINSMAIVGDFTGGWPVQDAETGEFDWTVAKQMTQADDANVWTLVIENFEAEAKKYEYKAAANNSWDGYKLPDEGNADFVFGTDMYPAGKYNLTFTVFVDKDSLALDVEKVVEPVTPAFADGTYYIMHAQEGLFIPVEGTNANLSADGAPFTFKFDEQTGAYSITGRDIFNTKKWFVEGEGGFFKFYYVLNNVKKYLAISSRNGLTEYDEGSEALTDGNSTWILLTQSSVEDEYMSYNVAGTEDLCGAAWDITKNKMARNTETNLFEWKAENITVTSEIKPEFKVVATLEDKGSVWYPEGDGTTNWVITLGALSTESTTAVDGIYTITISFDPATKAIKVAGEKTGDIQLLEPVIPEGTYYVMSSADDNPHLFLTANPAVDNEGTAFGFKFDGVTGAYTVFSGELQLGKCFIEGEGGFYKICRSEGNGNKSYFAINEAKELYSTDDADKAAWWSFILPEAKAYFYDYTVAGAIGSKNAGEADALFGLAWDVTNTANDLEFKSVDESTVIYTKTIKGVKLEANDVIYYKVVRDHSWNYKDWGFNDGANADYVITTAGTYDITFTFDPTAVLGNGFNLTCTAELDTVTGISVIAAEAQKGNVYDMQGRRVVKPAKGMYIVNGKKMYVK